MPTLPGHGLDPIPEVMRKGLTGMMVCSGLSFVATLSLLSFLAYKHFVSRRTSQSDDSIYPQGFFWLVNLFMIDFVQSIGDLFVTRFLVINSVTPGPYCTLQGVVLTTGDVGSAIWTFVIATHTFVLVVGKPKWREWVSEKSTSGKGRWIFSIAIWAFTLFCGLFGLIFIQPFHPEEGPYYDQAGAGWCWIDQQYFWARIVFTPAFLFFDMFSLTIMYCFMFCYIRIQARRLAKASTAEASEHNTSHELQSWEVNVEAGDPAQHTAPLQVVKMQSAVVTTNDRTTQPTQTRSTRPRPDKRLKQVSMILLCYPIMYIFVTLPLEISRLSQFAGKNFSLKAVYFGVCLFMTSGFLNVVLYTTTRKGIISWPRCLRKREYGSSRSTTRTHVSSFQPGGRLSLATIRPTPTVASKSSVASINPLVDGHAKLHDEKDSIWSTEIPKQGYAVPDRRPTTDYTRLT